MSAYFLEPHPAGHSLYVLAHDSVSGEIRTFKVERMQSARLLDTQFEIKYAGGKVRARPSTAEPNEQHAEARGCRAILWRRGVTFHVRREWKGRFRAGDEIRTRDILLGRQTLCQTELLPRFELNYSV